MTTPPHTTTVRQTRPVGFAEPTHQRAKRALKALTDGRIDDARENVAALPDEPPIAGAWKAYLGGLVAAEEKENGNLSLAEALFAKAATLARPHLNQDAPGQDLDAKRIAAASLHRLGWVYRRQENPDEAIAAHEDAFAMRKKFGSIEEQCETAISLGLDFDLARRHDQARVWYRRAMKLGAQAAEKPNRIEVEAISNLSASFAQEGLLDQAVEAARETRTWWLAHDPGAIDQARAQMKLGYALLRHGEALCETGTDHAAEVLNECLEHLSSAREALLPFGPKAAVDADWCLEQSDFVQRLLATIDT